MSETGGEKPIKIVHNPEWGNGEVDKYEEYETYYRVFFKKGTREVVAKDFVDTRPPFIEQPDGTVMREASFYALMGPPRTKHVEFESSGPFFPSGKADPDHSKWYPGGAYHQPQTLPPDVGRRWRHVILTAPSSAFAPYTPPLQVTDPAMLALIPDVFTKTSVPLVSDRARAVLEAQFPDGGYFLATTITAASSARTERDYFYWVPRHQLIFNAEKVAGEPEPKSALVWNFNHPSGDKVQWQLIHNAALRAYLQGLPYWGFHFNLRSTLFTSRCFHALKAARLTGLIENTATDRVQHYEQPPYNPWEMIGHID
ncbi:MAG: hypothetical protein IOD05_08785 [Rhodobacter sp.]|nr:hypothetical protein [Rhodobacter sp.]